MERKKLFISSMMRSGSTLLQRALNTHDSIYVEYQTDTQKIINFKKNFLSEVGCDDYHVLAHYNPVYSYSYRDFKRWAAKNHNQINCFISPENKIKDTASVVGVKEVLAEEFYSLLLRKNIYCLNIIRDPRDVIASMSFGKGQIHTGERRPILFDLRNWRKSFIFTKKNELNYKFKSILFEDLIFNTQTVLDDIYAWLDVEQIALHKVKTRLNQAAWQGNSSFGEKKPFDPSAIAKYKEVLPEGVVNYIEAVCYKEMLRLGYEVSIKSEDRASIIREFKEPFQVERLEFSVNYTASLENVNYELKRLEL